MNDVQCRIAELQAKGWTLAALADALGNHVNTLEKWKAGDRYPANSTSVLIAMAALAERTSIPAKRRRSVSSDGNIT